MGDRDAERGMEKACSGGKPDVALTVEYVLCGWKWIVGVISGCR